MKSEDDFRRYAMATADLLDLPIAPSDMSGMVAVFMNLARAAGLPVLAAPVAAASPLPLGVQIAAAPWREDLVFRVAAAVEIAGELAAAPPPTGRGAAHA